MSLVLSTALVEAVSEGRDVAEVSFKSEENACAHKYVQ